MIFGPVRDVVVASPFVIADLRGKASSTPRSIAEQASRDLESSAEKFRKPAKSATLAPMTSRRFVFGSFVLDMERGVLLCNGRPVAVGSKGILLLRTLVASAGTPVGKAQLMDAASLSTAVEDSNL